MPPFNQLSHLTEEKRQQQGANVRSINIRVSHDNNAVISQLIRVEFVFADTATKSRNNGADLGITQHFVEPSAFDIQNFSF